LGKDGGRMIMEKKKVSAYMTVYMTLTLAVVLSLCLTLIEGTRQNGIYLESECVTDIGLNSVLAEYHRELLSGYNLFAVDSSYGTDLPAMQNVEDRLNFYIEKNLSRDDIFLDWLMYRDLMGLKSERIEIKKARMFTDGHGAVFRRRAAEAMWDDLSGALFEEFQQWMQTVESEKMTETDIAARKKKLDRKLKEYDGIEKQISETKWITVKVTNPTSYLEKIRTKGILTWVIKDTSKLSDKILEESNLAGYRMKTGRCNQGNMTLEDNSLINDELERFLFQEYLMKYMGYYGSEKEDHALAYQVEYLLAGKVSDIENLKTVVNQIFAIREAANTAYIFSDQEKCAVADALASILATAMAIPEASSLIKEILLLGWAFAESIYDLQCLMQGGKIPLMKTSDTWHFTLENALKLTENSSVSKGVGLKYPDYLRILMWIEGEKTLTERAADMVEIDIRQTSGNENFRLDGCVDAVEACTDMKSVYGYNCEITREKGYSTQ